MPDCDLCYKYSQRRQRMMKPQIKEDEYSNYLMVCKNCYKKCLEEEKLALPIAQQDKHCRYDKKFFNLDTEIVYAYGENEEYLKKKAKQKLESRPTLKRTLSAGSILKIPRDTEKEKKHRLKLQQERKKLRKSKTNIL